jgi:hypothetical protein
MMWKTQNTVYRWPLIVVVSSIVVGLFMVTGIPSPLRVTATFWFFGFCPGFAVVRLLPVHGQLGQIFLAVLLSLVIDLVIAETMVLTHTWSPGAAVVLLSMICWSTAAFEIYSIRRREKRREVGAS